MQKPKLIVRPYRHSATHKWCLDLRSLGKGRQFFRHKSDADAERRRQLTTLERHGREAVGLSQRKLSGEHWRVIQLRYETARPGSQPGSPYRQAKAARQSP